MCQEAACLIERGRDQPAGTIPARPEVVAEGDDGLVPFDALSARLRQVEALRAVAESPSTRGSWCGGIAAGHLSQAAALEVGAVEVLRAGRRHRGRGGDLEERVRAATIWARR